MPLSRVRGNGIRNFRAGTKIERGFLRLASRADLGSEAASLLFSTADRNASAKIDLFGANLLSPASCQRLQAGSLRSPESNARETTQENARWQTSGRAILNVVCY